MLQLSTGRHRESQVIRHRRTSHPARCNCAEHSTNAVWLGPNIIQDWRFGRSEIPSPFHAGHVFHSSPNSSRRTNSPKASVHAELPGSPGYRQRTPATRRMGRIPRRAETTRQGGARSPSSRANRCPGLRRVATSHVSHIDHRSPGNASGGV